jgi:hypothetical protein
MIKPALSVAAGLTGSERSLLTVASPMKTPNSSENSAWTNDGSSPVCSFTPKNSTSFLDWVDFSQLIAVALASAGVFLLAMIYVAAD